MNISIESLKKALHIQENIEKLQHELGSIFGRAGAKVLGVMESGMKLATRGIEGIKVDRNKGKMSAAGRAAIVAAQKKRWAKIKKSKAARVEKPGTKAEKPVKRRKKGKMSAAGRAAIVAAQKKRWAKVKAGK